MKLLGLTDLEARRFKAVYLDTVAFLSAAMISMREKGITEVPPVMLFAALDPVDETVSHINLLPPDLLGPALNRNKAAVGGLMTRYVTEAPAEMVAAVALINEVWAVTSEPGQPRPDVPPSESPDRVSMLSIGVRIGDKAVGAMVPTGPSMAFPPFEELTRIAGSIYGLTIPKGLFHDADS